MAYLKLYQVTNLKHKFYWIADVFKIFCDQTDSFRLDLLDFGINSDSELWRTRFD